MFWARMKDLDVISSLPGFPFFSRKMGLWNTLVAISFFWETHKLLLHAAGGIVPVDYWAEWELPGHSLWAHAATYYHRKFVNNTAGSVDVMGQCELGAPWWDNSSFKLFTWQFLSAFPICVTAKDEQSVGSGGRGPGKACISNNAKTMG